MHSKKWHVQCRPGFSVFIVGLLASVSVVLAAPAEVKAQAAGAGAGSVSEMPLQLAQNNPTAGALAAQPEAVAAPPNGTFDRFDPLRIKGLTVNLAGPADTIDQGAFGLRSTLADSGIGYLIYGNSYFQDNLLRHSHPLYNSRANQVYAGQLPTYVASEFPFVTFDVSRFGPSDGQIVIGGAFVNTNWAPLGPNQVSLGTASYYQTFFDRKLELKVGYFANNLEFLGTYVGGSLASGVFGPNASIPVEQGESTLAFVRPGINLKANLPGNFYDKVGVQRAISPDGNVVEKRQNPTAASYQVSNSGVFVINEFGYRVPATPGSQQTWVRAAASYTSSNYVNFDRPGQRADHNYGLYLLADRQLLQTAPAKGTAAQGLYAGFSVMYAPPALNRFSQYYEGRLYGLGLIPGRPLDLLSFVVTSNVFSSNLVAQTRRAGGRAHTNSEAYSVSYSAHVYNGINLNLGVSYIDHPTPVAYTGSTGNGLNLYLGAVTFF